MLRSKDKTTHIETAAVHAGRETDPATGAVVPPIHVSTTYARDAEGGFSRGWKYTRYDNPTRRALERCVATLEGGVDAAAFGSGMAAVHAVFQCCRPGDRVVVTRDAYVGVTRLMNEVMIPWGLEVVFADLADDDAATAAIVPGTRLVWAETPSNPLLRITDLAHVVEIAHRAGAIAACDNTFATPVLQRPLEYGFDLVMHSSTKYLGGHSDVLGGIVVTREGGEWLESLRTIQSAGGAVPAPLDCHQVLRGIQTLPLRIHAQSERAAALAGWLTTHPRVERVHYPFLDAHPRVALAREQMAAGGGIVSIELADAATALAVANKTRLFVHATSLGGVESLIEHRASGEAPDTPTPKGLLRLSVGIEHLDDLRDDLAQALE